MLTTREVAERMNVSPETILRRYRSGELPGFRIASNALRFDADELEVYLATLRGGPDPTRPTPIRRTER
jgi:excisionase family DNA binding protein